MSLSSVSIAHAKNNLPQLIHEVETGQPVQVTRHGRPAAVLVSTALFAAMSAQRPDFAAELRQFRKQHQRELLSPAEGAALAAGRSRDLGRAVEL